MPYGEVFSALADPTRRHIFEALREQPMSVGEIAAGQPVSRPAVSQHLRVLQQARLVSVEPLGNRRMYRIERAGLEQLRAYLDSFWSDALTAYGAEIARRVQARQRDAAQASEAAEATAQPGSKPKRPRSKPKHTPKRQARRTRKRTS